MTEPEMGRSGQDTNRRPPLQRAIPLRGLPGADPDDQDPDDSGPWGASKLPFWPDKPATAPAAPDEPPSGPPAPRSAQPRSSGHPGESSGAHSGARQRPGPASPAEGVRSPGTGTSSGAVRPPRTPASSGAGRRVPGGMPSGADREVPADTSAAAGQPRPATAPSDAGSPAGAGTSSGASTPPVRSATAVPAPGVTSQDALPLLDLPAGRPASAVPATDRTATFAAEPPAATFATAATFAHSATFAPADDSGAPAAVPQPGPPVPPGDPGRSAHGRDRGGRRSLWLVPLVLIGAIVITAAALTGRAPDPVEAPVANPPGTPGPVGTGAIVIVTPSATPSGAPPSASVTPSVPATPTRTGSPTPTPTRTQARATPTPAAPPTRPAAVSGPIGPYSACVSGGNAVFTVTFTQSFEWHHAYIDVDGNRSSGYDADGRLGADYMVENDAFYRSTGTGWAWAEVGNSGLQTSRTGGGFRWQVPRSAIGDSGAFRVVFHGAGGAPEAYTPAVAAGTC